ncbi:diaminopimelate decarboxylase [Silvibacterium dinghuense]|uniref:Diaminopimelate decarboxylase n=1 Tax=Silvibacterium dinghuense TaxID=1560006 RepID=A0A4V1NVC2_9BACT|nr:diaminopimelate decarboxylase [Silvibacterium dinghuense]RXS95260.1 diaminopimelate decarboxylase [Silvibacterium dinghuense]GGH11935.1 diaminopimelate decarboxylase [Silvibacterium dinghuense]
MVPVRPFEYPGSKAPLSCGPVSLASLAKKHGTPLYVYSADAIRYRFGLFQQAFAGQRHLICYAVKANSSLAILKLLAAEGAGFDIVSGGELERVLAVAPEAAGRVVFSGVGKTAPELDLALRSGILLFNVESEGELELLAERAAKLRKRARIALRVNPDVFAETHPYISTGLREHKFGIDIRRARAVYRRAAQDKWLEPAGISVHIGSQIRTADPFGAAADRVAKLVRDLRKDGLPIQYLDAGGGLGIEYHAAQPFHPEEKVQQYAAAVRAAVSELSDITLLLEPGRFLVAQAGALLARVLYVKKNGEKTFVITDAGMNDLIRPTLYQAHHEILPVEPPSSRRTITADVVGPVCESGDFFARDRVLAPLKPGDLVAILDAGAYGMSLASNYNTRGRAAEVLVEGKRARLIRRRETLADMLSTETP